MPAPNAATAQGNHLSCSRARLPENIAKADSLVRPGAPDRSETRSVTPAKYSIKPALTANSVPKPRHNDRKSRTRPAFCPLAHGVPAYRRGPYSTVQLALCATHRGQVSASYRMYHRQRSAPEAVGAVFKGLNVIRLNEE